MCDFVFSPSEALMTSIIKSACSQWQLMRNMRGLTNGSDETKTCVHLKTPAVLTSLPHGEQWCLIVKLTLHSSSVSLNGGKKSRENSWIVLPAGDAQG